MEFIQMRRLKNWITMTGEIAIALIIGDYQNHIGPFRCLRGGCSNQDSAKEEQFFHMI
jgi:hypothetical protein